MQKILLARVAAFAVAAATAAASASATIVQYQTSLGNVEVRLYDAATPLSVANFMGYVDRGDWYNALLHRSATDFVIQGGRYRYDGSSQVEPANFPEVFQRPPVLNEPGISNVRGTISYAKLGPPDGEDPTPESINSATREWFFNVADNAANLDNQNGGFTVFGRVLGDGMDVIDAINALPTYAFQGAWNQGPMRDYTVDDYNNFEPVDGTNIVLMRVVEFETPAGDYDLNGTVDGGDFLAWQRTLGSETQAEADGNGDAVVNAADLGVWAATFGEVATAAVPAASSVPEPASLALLAAAGAALAGYRALRQRC